MRTMKIALLSLILTTSAIADVVKLETNDWSNKRTLIWSGTLQKIDPSSQIAFFSFKNGSQIEEFSVHITGSSRIHVEPSAEVHHFKDA